MEELINIESEELYEHHRFIVDPGQSILRIDKYLFTKIANVSRTKIQYAADASCILVNSKPVKNNYKIKPGDTISIVLPSPPRDTEILPENIPINIIHEDDELIIVNKVPGMVVHPAYSNYNGTLVNALLYHFDHLAGINTEKIRPGLVHRIDKDTSGLLVIAKTDFAMTFLAKQFYDHHIDREYIALVWGNVKNDKGTISSFIGRDPRDRKKMKAFNEEKNGKHAITHYQVLERFGKVTLVSCKLETGRTHQIRVHFKFIGHPLFGDQTYGGNEVLIGEKTSSYKKFISNCFEILPRQALHAKSLGFIHPAERKNVFYDSPLPDDMEMVLSKWRRYVQA